MSHKAIIFDLDGTLLDTLEDLALSVNAVLRSEGYNEHPVDKYRYFVGDGIEKLVERAFSKQGEQGKIDLQAMVKAVKEEYGRRWSNNTRPYPGVKELLDFLEEKQISKAIFSNKPHEFALLTIDTLLPEWNFVEIFGVGPGMPRKPDPHGALQIAEKLALTPREIIYLGDTATDMETAVAGGFYPVGALWGFRTAEELLASGARSLAQKPLDVADLFRR